MKDLLIVIVTTLIIALIWVGTETHKVAQQQVAKNDLLEIATPFNGKIDVDYLEELKEPAYE